MAVFFGGWWQRFLLEAPDAIFIAGICMTARHRCGQAAEPLNQLTAPHGVYFVAGNHEQFGDDAKYLHAISAAGVRVLSSEKVEVDGLQILGVPYRNAAGGKLALALDSMGWIVSGRVFCWCMLRPSGNC